MPVPGRTPITVAIPTMNGARHLAEALSGVLRQEGVPFDLLVSDDRSDDATLALVRARGGDRVRIVVNSERLGLAGNWNQCVALSRTPLVAVVHQDDVLRPGHLAAHVAAFEDDPGVGLVASASGVIDDAGNPVPETVVGRGGLGPEDRTFAPDEALARLAAGNPLRCSAVTLRAEAHAEAGGFDPRLRYVVDWDFWARVASRWSLAWRAAVTVDVRWHPASETHRFKTGTADLEESERVLGDLLGRLRDCSPAAAVEAGREARRRLGLAYLNRAYDGLKAGDGWLARYCLRRALRTWPGVALTIAARPRLAVLMAAAWAAPGRSGRWFGGPGGPNRACSTA